jgi:UDP-N-acetylmuramoyl-tripeptide--D-alanyl-D-alanine ligase
MATPIPPNRARFTLGELLACTGGRLRGPLADEALEVHGIGSDTRTLEPGQAYVALCGERFDGHQHLAAAAEAGAALAIVEREVPPEDGLTVLQVESTLRALRQVAALHLERWRALEGTRRVLAITGSAGKTTTKDAVGALLTAQRPGQVLVAAGNLNNLVGVPMTVLTLTPAHRFAVLELGTNRPGEIGALSALAEPDIGLVTLVAAAHTEGLGGVEAVATEKGALFQSLTRPAAIAIGNADDPRVARELSASPASQRLSYGEAEDAQLRIVEREARGLDSQRLVLQRPAGTMELCVPMLGRAGALGCAAALAMVEAALGSTLEPSSVAEAFAQLGSAGRMQARQLGSGLVLIDDSYNANPASCRASIEAASELAATLGRPLVLVLGEMRELGAQSGDEHRALGDAVADHGARLLIAVDGDAQRIAERAAELGVRAVFAADVDRAAELALAAVGPSDVVLVKGSRGVRTEQVVRALEGEHDDNGGSASHGDRAGVA